MKLKHLFMSLVMLLTGGASMWAEVQTVYSLDFENPNEYKSGWVMSANFDANVSQVAHGTGQALQLLSNSSRGSTYTYSFQDIEDYNYVMSFDFAIRGNGATNNAESGIKVFSGSNVLFSAIIPSTAYATNLSITGMEGTFTVADRNHDPAQWFHVELRGTVEGLYATVTNSTNSNVLVNNVKIAENATAPTSIQALTARNFTKLWLDDVIISQEVLTGSPVNSIAVNYKYNGTTIYTDNIDPTDKKVGDSFSVPFRNYVVVNGELYHTNNNSSGNYYVIDNQTLKLKNVFEKTLTKDYIDGGTIEHFVDLDGSTSNNGGSRGSYGSVYDNSAYTSANSIPAGIYKFIVRAYNKGRNSVIKVGDQVVVQLNTLGGSWNTTSISKVVVPQGGKVALTTGSARTIDPVDVIIAIKMGEIPQAGGDPVYVTNSSFENDFDGWTNTGNMAIQTNTSITKDGSKYAEYWQPNGTKGVEQSISNLPAGEYKLKVHARTRGTQSAYIYINDVKQNLDIDDSEKDYEVRAVVGDDATLRIGLSATGNGASSSWIACDNFRLTYFPILTTIEGRMNEGIKNAMETAVAAYNSNRTIETYNTAATALAAARASIEKYAAAGPALVAQKALIDGTNIYAAGWTSGFVATYNSLLEKYNNNTLNEENVVNPTIKTEWHASTDYNDLLTPWSIGGQACNNFDKSLYINTWSVEGQTDGTNFLVPFFEYWVADANSLANNTISTTVTDLPNGLYSISAWVRVRAKNGVSANDATGITLSANGGEAVDVTEGVQIGTQFNIKEYTAEAVVSNGTLTINFNVANTNISWLSFKNVKYTKIGDPATLAINTTAKYGTFVAPFEVELPTGVEAYTLTVKEGAIVKSDALSTIPANTPVMVHAEDGLAATTFYGKAVELEGELKAGNLVGNYGAPAAIPVSDGSKTNYLLQLQSGKVGFYKVVNAKNVGTNRCYLTVPAASGARDFFLIDGDETGISSIVTEMTSDNAVYDLSGRRVQKAQKGLYIVNGKKVIF